MIIDLKIVGLEVTRGEIHQRAIEKCHRSWPARLIRRQVRPVAEQRVVREERAEQREAHHRSTIDLS